MVEGFGDFLRDLRMRHCYTQKELGEIIGAGRDTIKKLEAGRNIPRRWVEALVESFPDYKPQIYVAARMLPPEISPEQESALYKIIDNS